LAWLYLHRQLMAYWIIWRDDNEVSLFEITYPAAKVCYSYLTRSDVHGIYADILWTMTRVASADQQPMTNGCS